MDVYQVWSVLRKSQICVDEKRKELDLLLKESNTCNIENVTQFYSSFIHKSSRQSLEENNKSCCNIKFQDADDVLKAKTNSFIELIKFIQCNPHTLASCLSTLDKNNTTNDPVDALISAIYLILHEQDVTTCDVRSRTYSSHDVNSRESVIPVIEHLIAIHSSAEVHNGTTDEHDLVRDSNGDQIRKMIRQRNSCLNVFLNTLFTHHPSLHTLTRVILHKPISFLLLNFSEEYLDFDSDKVMSRFTEKERVEEFGQPNTVEYMMKYEKHCNRTRSNFVAVVNTFINSIYDTLYFIPPNHVILKLIGACIKPQQNVCCVIDIPTRPMRSICVDILFDIFLCPLMLDTLSINEILDTDCSVELSEQSQINLLTVAQFLKDKAVAVGDMDAPALSPHHVDTNDQRNEILCEKLNSVVDSMLEKAVSLNRSTESSRYDLREADFPRVKQEEGSVPRGTSLLVNMEKYVDEQKLLDKVVVVSVEHLNILLNMFRFAVEDFSINIGNREETSDGEADCIAKLRDILANLPDTVEEGRLLDNASLATTSRISSVSPSSANINIWHLSRKLLSERLSKTMTITSKSNFTSQIFSNGEVRKGGDGASEDQEGGEFEQENDGSGREAEQQQHIMIGLVFTIDKRQCNLFVESNVISELEERINRNGENLNHISPYAFKTSPPYPSCFFHLQAPTTSTSTASHLFSDYCFFPEGGRERRDGRRRVSLRRPSVISRAVSDLDGQNKETEDGSDGFFMGRVIVDNNGPSSTTSSSNMQQQRSSDDPTRRKKMTRFSLSHDEFSIGGNMSETVSDDDDDDSNGGASDQAMFGEDDDDSNRSINSSLDNEEGLENDVIDAQNDERIMNDNLSDVVSANISGGGTPNISGRDTPQSSSCGGPPSSQGSSEGEGGGVSESEDQSINMERDAVALVVDGVRIASTDDSNHHVLNLVQSDHQNTPSSPFPQEDGVIESTNTSMQCVVVGSEFLPIAEDLSLHSPGGHLRRPLAHSSHNHHNIIINNMEQSNSPSTDLEEKFGRFEIERTNQDNSSRSTTSSVIGSVNNNVTVGHNELNPTDVTTSLIEEMPLPSSSSNFVVVSSTTVPTIPPPPSNVSSGLVGGGGGSSSLIRDDTLSLVSETWSTDVLGSDTEATLSEPPSSFHEQSPSSNVNWFITPSSAARVRRVRMSNASSSGGGTYNTTSSDLVSGGIGVGAGGAALDFSGFRSTLFPSSVPSQNNEKVSSGSCGVVSSSSGSGWSNMNEAQIGDLNHPSNSSPSMDSSQMPSSSDGLLLDLVTTTTTSNDLDRDDSNPELVEEEEGNVGCLIPTRPHAVVSSVRHETRAAVISPSSSSNTRDVLVVIGEGSGSYVHGQDEIGANVVVTPSTSNLNDVNSSVAVGDVSSSAYSVCSDAWSIDANIAASDIDETTRIGEFDWTKSEDNSKSDTDFLMDSLTNVSTNSNLNNTPKSSTSSRTQEQSNQHSSNIKFPPFLNTKSNVQTVQNSGNRRSPPLSQAFKPREDEEVGEGGGGANSQIIVEGEGCISNLLLHMNNDDENGGAVIDLNVEEGGRRRRGEGVTANFVDDDDDTSMNDNTSFPRIEDMEDNEDVNVRPVVPTSSTTGTESSLNSNNFFSNWKMNLKMKGDAARSRFTPKRKSTLTSITSDGGNNVIGGSSSSSQRQSATFTKGGGVQMDWLNEREGVGRSTFERGVMPVLDTAGDDILAKYMTPPKHKTPSTEISPPSKVRHTNDDNNDVNEGEEMKEEVAGERPNDDEQIDVSIVDSTSENDKRNLKVNRRGVNASVNGSNSPTSPSFSLSSSPPSRSSNRNLNTTQNDQVKQEITHTTQQNSYSIRTTNHSMPILTTLLRRIFTRIHPKSYLLSSQSSTTDEERDKLRSLLNMLQFDHSCSHDLTLRSAVEQALNCLLTSPSPTSTCISETLLRDSTSRSTLYLPYLSEMQRRLWVVRQSQRLFHFEVGRVRSVTQRQAIHCSVRRSLTNNSNHGSGSVLANRLSQFGRDFKRASSSAAQDERVALLTSFIHSLYMQMVRGGGGCEQVGADKKEGSSVEINEMIRLSVERVVISTVFSFVIFPNGDADISRDKVLSEHITTLQSSSHSQLPDRLMNNEMLYTFTSAQHHLLMISLVVTPFDIVTSVSTACKAILATLSCCDPSTSTPSADDLLPVLVHLLIQTNPPHLLSTIQYVNSFDDAYHSTIGSDASAIAVSSSSSSNGCLMVNDTANNGCGAALTCGLRPPLLSGEVHYWWIQFVSAVEYIKTLDPPPSVVGEDAVNIKDEK